jgi:CspA family cold shock protein
MLVGTIARILAEKGIGFIRPSGPGKDVFFHCSAVADEQFEQLHEGQAVSYELDTIESTRERPRASRVQPCDSKLLGRRAPDETPPERHPRARGRKPTWRR